MSAPGGGDALPRSDDALLRSDARWQPILLDADLTQALSLPWAVRRLERSGRIRVIPFNAGLDPELDDGRVVELAPGVPRAGDVVLARTVDGLRLLRVVKAGETLACKTDCDAQPRSLARADVLAVRRGALAPLRAVSSRALPPLHRAIRGMRRHARRHLKETATADASVLRRYSDAANVQSYVRKTPAGLDPLEQRLVEAWFPRPGRILVGGGAAGRMPLAFARLGWEVVALDISEPMLAATREACAGLPVTCVRGNVESPPVRGPFDAMALGLYVHSNVPHRARRTAMLRRWSDLLAPGAPVLLSVRRYRGALDYLAKNALLPLMGGELREWGDWSGLDLGGDLRPVAFYYHFFTRRELARELRAGGFTCVEQAGEMAVAVSGRRVRGGADRS